MRGATDRKRNWRREIQKWHPVSTFPGSVGGAPDESAVYAARKKTPRKTIYAARARRDSAFDRMGTTLARVGRCRKPISSAAWRSESPHPEPRVQSTPFVHSAVPLEGTDQGLDRGLLKARAASGVVCGWV